MSTAPASETATQSGKETKSNPSEDTIIFGSAPSHLFDEIALRIDNLVTEEISALPLLPRKKKNESNTEQSGEEILVSSLRKAYKKNLDVVEAYCARNVFTIESFNKTKRRKVLNHFLNGGEEGDEGVEPEETVDAAVPKSKFDPPTKNEELPTAQQIMAMDKEILLARQRLHSEKLRRSKLSRQIERLKGVMGSLSVVQDALKGDDGKGFDRLQENIRKAVDGHQEIKVWNGKAEDVIQLLDKIKAKRVGVAISGAANVEAKRAVTRDIDEKDRRRVWEEMYGGEVGREGGAGTHGSSEEIASLLKKLKEK